MNKRKTVILAACVCAVIPGILFFRGHGPSNAYLAGLAAGMVCTLAIVMFKKRKSRSL